METIFLKKEETKTIETPIEIDVENCFFYAKYDLNYSQVDAFIGRFLKDGFFYTIEWYTHHGELYLKSKKDKRVYISKTDFQLFINKFRDCEKISDVDFFHAYEKIKTGHLLSKI